MRDVSPQSSMPSAIDPGRRPRLGGLASGDAKA